MQLIIGTLLTVFRGGGTHRLNFYDVICVENLLKAWREFKKGKRSKPDVAKFEFNLEENLFRLHEDLLSGKWQPNPYVVAYITDPKLRKIHIASVRDRVLYQAIYQNLYKIFDPSFIFDSYASRKEKGTHRGINKLNIFINKVTQNKRKRGYVLKCDIRKFFDSVNHNVLKKIIKKRITDERLLILIEKIINSLENLPGRALPLGNVTSQLFSNIYLNELDQFVKHKLKAKYYARYCDDFVIVSDSPNFLNGCLVKVRDFCRDELLVDLHPNKVEIRKIHLGIDFLGYVSLPHYKVLRTRTKNRMMKKLTKLKNEYDLGKVEKDKIEQVLQSYFGMLKHCRSNKIKHKIQDLFKLNEDGSPPCAIR
jgi:retron-type reverse transcriptase